MTRVYVSFECDHAGWIPGDEYGDGSAWCQRCGVFRCYEDAEPPRPEPVSAYLTRSGWRTRTPNGQIAPKRGER